MSQLLALGLPVVTRHADPVHGLAFDFLSNVPAGRTCSPATTPA